MSWIQQMSSADQALQQGNLEGAESMLWNALESANQFGNQSPQLMETGDKLAQVLMEQSKFNQAEDLLLRLAQVQSQGGLSTSALTGKTLLRLASLYYAQGKFKQAEPFGLNALRIYESTFGRDHAETANVVANMGYISHAQGKLNEAGQYYERAIALKKRLPGDNYADLQNLIELYAGILELTGRGHEVAALRQAH